MKRIIKLVNSRRAIIILILIALISYGRMVEMNFWQDDNALVFKFTHINEDAGYLGKGIFGEGAYRYTVTPYIPIFHFFGYNPVAYFTFALVFFLFSVCSVYLFFCTLFENRGKAFISGFLYAAGYVASDGFIRMFNSVLTSLSVMFVCGTIGWYYKYFKTRNISWYGLSVLFYFLAIQIGYIRTHFLIFVVIAFELLFFTFYKVDSLKVLVAKIPVSIVRLSPFVFLFYKWFLVNADNRSGQVVVVAKSLLRGELYNTYSFFASLGNILLPNEIFPNLISLLQNVFHTVPIENKVAGVVWVAFVVLISYLAISKIASVKAVTGIAVAGAIIAFVARKTFSYPGLIGSFNEKTSLYAGIFFLALCAVLLRYLSHKRLALLLVIWMAVNMAAYGAYIPIYAYPSDNRYLLQSFIPLIGLLALWAYELWQRDSRARLTILPIVLVFIWGGLNLYSAVTWQQKIIEHRTNPSKRFFTQLKEYVPQFEKGSVFYFFIPDKPYADNHYNNGFSVAQMPEETAIAWRYGVDRYDLKIVNNFEDLKRKVTEDKVTPDKVYAFIADPDNLVDVTRKMRDLLENGFSQESKMSGVSYLDTEQLKENKEISMKPLIIYPKDISALAPIKVTMTISGAALPGGSLNFPVYSKEAGSSVADEKTRQYYLEFRKWQELFNQSVEVSATTTWKNYIPQLLLDKDKETYWEADRIAWDDHNQGLVIDLGKVIEVGGVYYLNGPRSLLPTRFTVSVSGDGTNYTQVKESVVNAALGENIQKVLFEKQKAQFIKLMFHETLYNDAPGVSEIGVIPAEFSSIDLALAENFFRNPFSTVGSLPEWNSLINSFQDKGLIKVSWKTDASDKIQTTVRSTLPIVYDGREQELSIEIPAGGQKLEYLEVIPVTIPGTVNISKIRYENIPLVTR